MRYFRVLTISLCFHLLLGLLLSLLPEPPHIQTHQPTFVELLEKPELPRRPHQEPRDEKQFVRHVEVPERLRTEKRRDARFASDEERYVLEEQKARLNDLTVNRAASASASSTAESRTKMMERRALASRHKTKSKMDFSPESPLERAREELLKGGAQPSDVKVGGLRGRAVNGADESAPLIPSFAGIERGFSTLGEQLPDDIKFGDFTALNTDRHLYYTFYARMEEKIRNRWVSYARAAVYNLPNDPHHYTGKDNWITKLEVILDPKGRFVRAILHESSGIQSLDAAPVQAFKDAGQFPNPPAEMIKTDGAIHIYYAFNVTMTPSHFADKD